MAERHPGGSVITDSITKASGVALCAYLTADYPTPTRFRELLPAVASVADVVEIGVPFTDPMADGHTIQRASRVALEHGVSLAGILEMLEELGPGLDAPYLLMGYYNPFLALGLDELGDGLTRAGCAGLIVPDLPYEESGPIREVLEPGGQALVQLVTPATPDQRLAKVAAASQGFVYAVTVTGITGGSGELPEWLPAYLDRVREAASLPVLAGFGIRSRDQVESLAPHLAGVVVGSALIEAIDAGSDPAEFLSGLRVSGVSA